MRKTIIYSILSVILVGLCTYRYLSLNQGIPKQVIIQQHLSGDYVEVEGNMATVRYEISNLPFREKDKVPGLNKGNKYVKIYLSIKNNSNKELDPTHFLLSQDLRKGNNLHNTGLDNIKNIEKIKPYQTNTYLKYAVIKKEELKYGIFFVLPVTFKKDLSVEEQKQKLILRNEWVLIPKQA